MFTAVLFLVKKWKELQCPATDEWINKVRYILTVAHYLSIKRSGVLRHATTW